jgi:hypothetical protein
MEKSSALIEEAEPKRVVRALKRAAAEDLRLLDEAIPLAIRGRPVAVRRYVKSWKHLRAHLVETARSREGSDVPDWHPSEVTLDLLDQGALHAPFSPWVVEFGPGPGAALFLLSEIRRYMPASNPVMPTGPVEFPPHPGLKEREFKRFARLVWHELTSEDPLEMIASVFDLSDTELGDLFGVTRQGVIQWMEKGIPGSRQPRVHQIQRIADVLRRNLKADRLPAVVREAAPAYGNRSILEAIKRGDEKKVLGAVERAFDWAATA